MRWSERLIGLLFFLPAAVVLTIALWLQPDPVGMGTHQQLGLSPCGFLLVCELPCPMCGMTTTFSHLAHLQILQGIQNQPFGGVLFAIMLFLGSMGFLDLVYPKKRMLWVWDQFQKYDYLITISLLVGLFLGWVYKIIIVKYWMI